MADANAPGAPLLTKDAINIGGHKLPIQLLGALAAIAGVILVIRARQRGSNVAAIGAQPSAYVPPSDLGGFGAGSFSPDYGPALSNLSAQVQSLQSSQQAAAALPQTAPGYLAGSANPGLASIPGGEVPVYAAPGNEVYGKGWLGLLPLGTQLQPAGPAIAETQWGSGPLQYSSIPITLPGGVTGYVHSTDITPGQVNPATAI